MLHLAIALGLALTGLPSRASTAPAPAYFPTHLATDRVVCAVRWSGGLNVLIGDLEQKWFGRPQVVMSDFRNRWYAGQLAAAGEPSLSDPAGPASTGTSLRFTWLRSFHPAMMVRVELDGSGRSRVVARQLSGAGGDEPGTVARWIDRPLARAEARSLAALLRRTRVLALPPGECTTGLDGAEWLIEAAGPGGYRFIGRWSPRDGPVRELGLAMLALTGWRIGDVY